MKRTEAAAVLGTSLEPSPAELSAAWRRAARALHPDNGGDAALFVRARTAHHVLANVRPAVPAPARTRTGERKLWAFVGLVLAFLTVNAIFGRPADHSGGSDDGLILPLILMGVTPLLWACRPERRAPACRAPGKSVARR